MNASPFMYEHAPQKQKHNWNYISFNQLYLAKGKIAPVILLQNRYSLLAFPKLNNEVSI